MTTNLDAFAAQFFREWRRVGSERRAERIKPQRVTDALDYQIGTDPSSAWPLVVAIVERARSHEELRQAVDFALVPFVIASRDEFIGRLDAESGRNPVFARALSLLAADYPHLTPPAHDIAQP